MTNSFKKVGFTYYPVADVARSRKFYEGILGLVPGEDFQGTWQEYDLDGTTFAISSSIIEFVKPGTQASVAFEVGDLGKLIPELKSKGVLFVSEEAMETPVCFMAFIKDPDGNTISLHQLKS
jgi:catechol 2,3-dioxygenase-like lactoylglutathione lyase family enzyme